MLCKRRLPPSLTPINVKHWPQVLQPLLDVPHTRNLLVKEKNNSQATIGSARIPSEEWICYLSYEIWNGSLLQLLKDKETKQMKALVNEMNFFFLCCITHFCECITSMPFNYIFYMHLSNVCNVGD